MYLLLYCCNDIPVGISAVLLFTSPSMYCNGSNTGIFRHACVFNRIDVLTVIADSHFY